MIWYQHIQFSETEKYSKASLKQLGACLWIKKVQTSSAKLNNCTETSHFLPEFSSKQQTNIPGT